MTYTEYNVPRGKEIWACAYSTNGTEKSMALKKQPVLGMVIDEENTWKGAKFYEIGKNGKIKKSSGVNVSARVYADTFEECVIEYNARVQYQIDFLEALKKRCLDDMLVLDFEEE